MFGGQDEGRCMVRAFQYNKYGNHKGLSNCYVQLSELKNAPNGELTVKMGVGNLILKETIIQDKVTFLDYVTGGLKIGVQIAIDYTMSNYPVIHP